MLEGHGDDIYLFKNIKYNFSSNVIYHGTPPALLEHIKQSISKISNYPSPTAHELNSLAAQHHNIESEQVLFTNGATEAFYLIAQQFRGSTARIFTPTFSEYESACVTHDITCTFSSRDTVPSRITEDLCFICNPNNPDGALLSLDYLCNIIAENSATIFIIDEAYIDFSSDAETVLALINKFDNLIVVRSLTKNFAIPGIRLGYLVSNPQMIENLLKWKMVWSVNALAIEAGKWIFNQKKQNSFSLSQLSSERDQFMKQLEKIPYLETVPTNTNYFLCKLIKGTSAKLKSYLAEQGILIRDASNFRGIENEYIRLSVQSPEAINALMKALEQWN
jgi:threonine-phosphate decarboxylase